MKTFFSKFIFLALFAVLFSFVSVSVVHAQNASPCTITSFTATPSTLSAAGTVILNWSSTGCDTLNINGGIYSNVAAALNNSMANTLPTVSQTTTYVMTGQPGSVTKSLTVTVGTLSSANFKIGDAVQTIQTTTGINIRSTAAGSVIGTVAGAGTTGVILDGPVTATLSGTSYVWWKINFADGKYIGWTAENYLEKSIPGGNPPPAGTTTVDIKANGSDGPVTLTAGQNLTLSWKSSGADTTSNLPYQITYGGVDSPVTYSWPAGALTPSCTLSAPIRNTTDIYSDTTFSNPVPSNYSLSFSSALHLYPTVTTTYTITCGTAHDSVTVTPAAPKTPDTSTVSVNLQASIDKLHTWHEGTTADPITIVAGQRLFFTWTSNASSCQLGAPLNMVVPPVASGFSGAAGIYQYSDSTYANITWLQYDSGSRGNNGNGPYLYPPSGTTQTYTITCAGANGSLATDSVTVANATPATPQIDFSVNGVSTPNGRVPMGDVPDLQIDGKIPVVLNWHIVGGAFCTMSGGRAPDLSSYLGSETNPPSMGTLSISPGQAGYPPPGMMSSYSFYCSTGLNPNPGNNVSGNYGPNKNITGPIDTGFGYTVVVKNTATPTVTLQVGIDGTNNSNIPRTNGTVTVSANQKVYLKAKTISANQVCTLKTTNYIKGPANSYGYSSLTPNSTTKTLTGSLSYDWTETITGMVNYGITCAETGVGTSTYVAYGEDGFSVSVQGFSTMPPVTPPAPAGVYPPGCTSNSGVSTTTGQRCDGTPGNSQSGAGEGSLPPITSITPDPSGTNVPVRVRINSSGLLSRYNIGFVSQNPDYTDPGTTSFTSDPVVAADGSNVMVTVNLRGVGGIWSARIIDPVTYATSPWFNFGPGSSNGGNSGGALPPDCQPGDLFSHTTGHSCSGTTLPPGCQLGDLFSRTTGQSCGNGGSGGAGAGAGAGASAGAAANANTGNSSSVHLQATGTNPTTLSWTVASSITSCFKSSVPASEFTGVLIPVNSGSVQVYPTEAITYKITCGDLFSSVAVNTSGEQQTTGNNFSDTSNKFSIGDTVSVTSITTGTINVRSSANNNNDSNILGGVSLGTTGTVMDGPVSSPSYVWWKINFGSVTGWSVQDYLTKVSVGSGSNGGGGTSGAGAAAPVARDVTPVVSTIACPAYDGSLGLGEVEAVAMYILPTDWTYNTNVTPKTVTIPGVGTVPVFPNLPVQYSRISGGTAQDSRESVLLFTDNTLRAADGTVLRDLKADGFPSLNIGFGMNGTTVTSDSVKRQSNGQPLMAPSINIFKSMGMPNALVAAFNSKGLSPFSFAGHCIPTATVFH